MDLVKKLTESQLKPDAVNFGIGDTVRVHIRVKEGNRERIKKSLGRTMAKSAPSAPICSIGPRHWSMPWPS